MSLLTTFSTSNVVSLILGISFSKVIVSFLLEVTIALGFDLEVLLDADLDAASLDGEDFLAIFREEFVGFADFSTDRTFGVGSTLTGWEMI